MTLFEDEALCRAYVEVSVDSANQMVERLWEVVAAKYHEQPSISIARTSFSLQSRYQMISSCIILYVAKLSQAMHNQRSCTNEMDWVNYILPTYIFHKNIVIIV